MDSPEAVARETNPKTDFFLHYSRQVSHSDLAQRRPGSENHRSQVHDQIPAEEGVMSGCSGRQRRDDGGRADRKHNAGHQLFGQLAEEGLAERRKLDDQGQHEPAEAVILDVAFCIVGIIDHDS